MFQLCSFYLIIKLLYVFLFFKKKDAIQESQGSSMGGYMETIFEQNCTYYQGILFCHC